MVVINRNSLNENLKNDGVGAYYEILNKKKGSLYIKRVFDIIVSFILLIVLSPLLIFIALSIKFTSKGPVFYKQERVTINYKIFKIFKFRTMVENADKIGSLVTINDDPRVTKIGAFLRKYRLDELPQLINILIGDMSFVGARPEVLKYVNKYSDEMKATLLMPAGVTSLASINFKDEDKLLSNAQDADNVYINEILPRKMQYNLEYIKRFNFFYDIKIMIETVIAVIKN